MSSASPAEIEYIRELLRTHQHQKALQTASALKSTRVPLPELDYLRAMAFLGLGRPHDALESAKEGLRFFPDDPKCMRVLNEIHKHSNSKISDDSNNELKDLLERIRPYTMVGVERLFSLYHLAKHICEKDVPGDFIECGVAAGGSSALLAAVIKKYSKQPRVCWSCDTFEGMPDPDIFDTHTGIKANETGWGAGTCAAPVESLKKVAAEVGVSDIIRPVKGLFHETLPKLRESLAAVAFLHADGDWHKSTMDIFIHLYDLIPDGGIVQIDDYGFWQGCQKAVHDFQSSRNLQFHLRKIDATGVWFEKQSQTISPPLPLLPPSWDLPTREVSKDLGALNHPRRMLNVGCGSSFHEDWINLDIAPRHASIIQHDLKRALPFANESFHAVYNSHVLEHLPRSDGRFFIKECFRVLLPNGIVRVVVPDLETIAKLYLSYLEESEKGDPTAMQRYEWMTLELLDQMVREKSGGDMLRYFKQNPMPAEEFVLQRLGQELKQTLRYLRSQPKTGHGISPNQEEYESRDTAAFHQFLQSGELHKWMYDRYSLRCLLESVGFENVRVVKAWESDIPQFASYYLDCMPDGSVRKADSLFMEAVKP